MVGSSLHRAVGVGPLPDTDDASGNTGVASEVATARTGNTLTQRIEGESLLPPVAGTASAQAQGNCCGVTWSNNAQLFVLATAAGQYVTVAFNVLATGSYDLSVVQTKAADYGINTISIDSTQVGSSFDAYNNGVTITPPVDYGNLDLAAGRHTLTLTVTGKNAASIGYLAGIDYLQLQYLDG